MQAAGCTIVLASASTCASVAASSRSDAVKHGSTATVAAAVLVLAVLASSRQR